MARCRTLPQGLLVKGIRWCARIIPREILRITDDSVPGAATCVIAVLGCNRCDVEQWSFSEPFAVCDKFSNALNPSNNHRHAAKSKGCVVMKLPYWNEILTRCPRLGFGHHTNIRDCVFVWVGLIGGKFVWSSDAPIVEFASVALGMNKAWYAESYQAALFVYSNLLSHCISKRRVNVRFLSVKIDRCFHIWLLVTSCLVKGSAPSCLFIYRRISL